MGAKNRKEKKTAKATQYKKTPPLAPDLRFYTRRRRKHAGSPPRTHRRAPSSSIQNRAAAGCPLHIPVLTKLPRSPASSLPPRRQHR